MLIAHKKESLCILTHVHVGYTLMHYVHQATITVIFAELVYWVFLIVFHPLQV